MNFSILALVSIFVSSMAFSQSGKEPKHEDRFKYLKDGQRYSWTDTNGKKCEFEITLDKRMRHVYIDSLGCSDQTGHTNVHTFACSSSDTHELAFVCEEYYSEAQLPTFAPFPSGPDSFENCERVSKSADKCTTVSWSSMYNKVIFRPLPNGSLIMWNQSFGSRVVSETYDTWDVKTTYSDQGTTHQRAGGARSWTSPSPAVVRDIKLFESSRYKVNPVKR